MMSNKKPEGRGKRPYTLRARARRREEVHRRITKAAVYLHGKLGPARTTVSEIAQRAGVRRATVYNHFPSELDLIDACSSHWFGENPPPDPSLWTQIPDPARRVESALGSMYAYYEQGQEMLAKVLRDAPLVAALQEILGRKWQPLLDGIVEALAMGYSASASHSQEEAAAPPDARRHGGGPVLLASLRVALDFFTWQTLAASGLSPDEAARIAAAWIEAGRASALRKDESG